MKLKVLLKNGLANLEILQQIWPQKVFDFCAFLKRSLLETLSKFYQHFNRFFYQFSSVKKSIN